jgi:adenosyl cobinamide kinase/adenosyl cobinamide phosphate guanylyltransferase
MRKIIVSAEIEFDEDLWYSHADKEEMDWFKSIMSDHTTLILHSNEVGDTICETNNFKWEII